MNQLLETKFNPEYVHMHTQAWEQQVLVLIFPSDLPSNSSKIYLIL